MRNYLVLGIGNEAAVQVVVNNRGYFQAITENNHSHSFRRLLIEHKIITNSRDEIYAGDLDRGDTIKSNNPEDLVSFIKFLKDRCEAAGVELDIVRTGDLAQMSQDVITLGVKCAGVDKVSEAIADGMNSASKQSA